MATYMDGMEGGKHNSDKTDTYRPPNPSRKLTYEERIRWFFERYYETGMEYEALLESMKDENLDAFEWYNELVCIPKYS